jgi:hypothetical protein
LHTETPRHSIYGMDALEFSNIAVPILKAAWKPPCLDYTPEYLTWYCTFPSDLPLIALSYDRDNGSIAVVAAAGRRTSLGSVYFSSFFSMIPGSSPAVPMILIHREAKAIMASHAGVVAFTEPGSTGEQLLACFESSGLRRSLLAEYRMYAAGPSRLASDIDVQTVDAQLWAREANRLRDDSTLSLLFDVPTMQHLSRDPMERQFLLAKHRNVVVGSAMISSPSTVSQSGRRAIPTLHSVRLRDQSTIGLRALLAFACGKDPSVRVPDVTGIASETIKESGLRELPILYTAYLFSQ